MTAPPRDPEDDFVLPCAIDGCKQPSLMPASEYCSLHSAIGTSPTGGEFATQPAEPPAQDATDDLVQRFPELNMCNYNEDDVSSLNEWGIKATAELQRQAREIAALRMAVKDDAQWAQENERLTRELDRVKVQLTSEITAALAERDALRECVQLLYSDLQRYAPNSAGSIAARAKVKT